MSADRWYRKADAFVTAWVRRYGSVPTKHAAILGLCQPSAETACGDAWRGPDGILNTADDTRNWGAATARSLNAEELAAIKASGITPTVGAGHEDRAKAAQAAVVAAGLPVPSGMLASKHAEGGIPYPRAEIHCDSRTELRADGSKAQVPYFVWFAAFDTDDAGAEYYLTFVADAGNPARTVLDNPTGNVYQLAAAVYSRGYFFGFHPHANYTTAGADKIMGTADDVAHDGNAENISAYADWLRPHFTTISTALQNWTPGSEIGELPGPGEPTGTPQPEPVDLSTSRGVQRALNALGCARPILKIDGDFATKSIAALGFYEGPALAVTGELIDITGKFPLLSATRAAMLRDLLAIGVSVVM